MKALVIGNPLQFGDLWEIAAINYGSDGLVIAIRDPGADKKATVLFETILGFRVLDEGDLLEFWPECSLSNGWIFQIQDGGWYAQECQRPGFLARDTNKGVSEYLITSCNECVNVLSWSQPVIDVRQ